MQYLKSSISGKPQLLVPTKKVSLSSKIDRALKTWCNDGRCLVINCCTLGVCTVCIFLYWLVNYSRIITCMSLNFYSFQETILLTLKGQVNIRPAQKLQKLFHRQWLGCTANFLGVQKVIIFVVINTSLQMLFVANDVSEIIFILSSSVKIIVSMIIQLVSIQLLL